jgi:hypothetical protein
MIGLDHSPPGISTDSARGPETTGNTRMIRANATREEATPLTSGTALLLGSTIGISAGQRYRTSNPVTDRPMIIRCISDVPSKIVKILAAAAVYAGQRPSGSRGISTDSARPVRDGSRFRVGPCRLSVVVRTHTEKVLERFRGCYRQPTPQRVHPRHILPVTCEYLAAHDSRPRVRGADRAHAGRTPGGRRTPGLAAVAPTRRRRGPTGPVPRQRQRTALQHRYLTPRRPGPMCGQGGYLSSLK